MDSCLLRQGVPQECKGFNQFVVLILQLVVVFAGKWRELRL